MHGEWTHWVQEGGTGRGSTGEVDMVGVPRRRKVLKCVVGDELRELARDNAGNVTISNVCKVPSLATITVEVTDADIDGGNPGELDSCCLDKTRIQQYKASKKMDLDSDQHRLLCYMTPLFPGNYEGSIKCIVIVRLENRYNSEFWAHKADWSKEALQLFRIEAPSYFLQEFNYLHSVQMRDTPFGENVGKVTKRKCGTFPVNALMMIVEAGGKGSLPLNMCIFSLGKSSTFWDPRNTSLCTGRWFLPMPQEGWLNHLPKMTTYFGSSCKHATLMSKGTPPQCNVTGQGHHFCHEHNIP